MRLLVLGLMIAAMPPMAQGGPLTARIADLAAGTTPPVTQAQSFDCSKLTCTQIASCAEACHKLLVCGHAARDRDRDGIPCENLCAQPC